MKFRVRSASAVGVGLIVAGSFTYAFHALAARQLDLEDFATFGGLWSLYFLTSIVSFLGVEQTIASRISRGRGTALHGSGGIRLGFVVIAVGMIPVATKPLWGELVGIGELAMLGLGVAGYGFVSVVRGTASGAGRFRLYAVVLGADAGARLAIALALVMIGGSGRVAVYAAMAVAPWVAAVLGWVFLRDLRERLFGDGEAGLLGAGTLALGNLGLIGLLNLGPLLLSWRGAGEEVAALFAGLLLVRIPLYLFNSVTTAVLPAVSRMVEDRTHLKVWERASRWSVATVAVVAGVVGLAGPMVGWLTRLVFGAGVVVSFREFVLLGVAIAFVMGALLLNQFFIAISDEGAVAKAWLAGLTIFVLAGVGLSATAEVVAGALLAAGVVVFGVLVVSGWVNHAKPPRVDVAIDPADPQ